MIGWQTEAGGLVPELMQLMMPDGQVVWAAVESAGPGGGSGGPSDAGLGERAVLHLRGFQESLRSVASSVHEALTTVQPDEISVSFGLELALSKHGIVAAIAGAGGKATFNVSLKWSPRPANPAEPAPASAPIAS